MPAIARRALLGLFLVLGVIVAGLACGANDDAEPGAVHVLTIDGGIDPITERYVDRGIGRAEDAEAMLVVIELDTPGGLVSSMRDIVQRIESSNVPVAVYVTPSGGRAASAGTFITMAGHIAAMAPGTSIGAASVVNSDGSDLNETLGRKATEDTAAFARGLADLRGRNAEWADNAVREAISATASEAVELKVVDFVANSRQDLLERVANTEVQLNPTTVVTIGPAATAPIVTTNLTTWERFLGFIANPNIAALLLTIGFLGITVELLGPGTLIPGTVGAIALALGFMGFGVLPVDTAGLVLIGIGLALLALELLVPSGGVLGIGGLIALVLGGIVAFRDTPSEFQPSRIVTALLLTLVIAIFLSVALGVLRARKISIAVGTEAMLGARARVRTPMTPEGFIFIEGERWRARLVDGNAQPGDTVRIVGADGLQLVVEKENQP